MKERRKKRCDRCGTHECYGGEDCFDLRDRSLEAYAEGRTLALTRAATTLEGRHYMELTRLEEVMRFAAAMGWRRIGVAFCVGLSEEARVLCRILSRQFEVVAACCKTGGVEKERLGLDKIREDRFEAMCNPVAQALLLNDAGTDLNLLVGLCVGHDIIFSQRSAAPVSVLVVKDRVLAHNPAGALHTGYYRKKLGLRR